MNTRKYFAGFGAVFFSILLTFIPAITHAKAGTDVYLVNHFGRPITFTITAGTDVFPELSGPFTLGVGEELRVTAVETVKQAYIYGVADKIYKAFWGLKIENSQPQFYYYSEPRNGIMFSWKNNTITFCTLDEFKTKHSC